MAGVAEKVKALIEEGVEDRDDITERIIADTSHEEFLEMVRPVIAWQVGSVLRSYARRSEQREFPAPTAKGTPPRGTVVDDLRGLIATTFVLDDGTRVTWGEATVEQHQRRATMLRLHAERVGATADRHERAAQMIAEGGASCLSDLLDEPVIKPAHKKKAA